MEQDEKFMKEALREAHAALEEGEIPIGAVVVWKGRIIGRGHNQTERLRDTTAHAEMIAITAATEALGGKYLTDCALYVTVEPCPMGPDRNRGVRRPGPPPRLFIVPAFPATSQNSHPRRRTAGGMLQSYGRVF